MSTPKVFESEYRFCLILWDHEPIKSRDLAQLCEEQLGWKVTTTYTVIKRLSERGVIKNENTIVSSLVSKEQIQTAEIEELVEKKFAGSIPAFLTAFTKSQQLTADEIQEMQQMIDRFRNEHQCRMACSGCSSCSHHVPQSSKMAVPLIVELCLDPASHAKRIGKSLECHS